MASVPQELTQLALTFTWSFRTNTNFRNQVLRDGGYNSISLKKYFQVLALSAPAFKSDIYLLLPSLKKGMSSEDVSRIINFLDEFYSKKDNYRDLERKDNPLISAEDKKELAEITKGPAEKKEGLLDKFFDRKDKEEQEKSVTSSGKTQDQKPPQEEKPPSPVEIKTPAIPWLPQYKPETIPKPKPPAAALQPRPSLIRSLKVPYGLKKIALDAVSFVKRKVKPSPAITAAVIGGIIGAVTEGPGAALLYGAAGFGIAKVLKLDEQKRAVYYLQEEDDSEDREPASGSSQPSFEIRQPRPRRLGAGGLPFRGLSSAGRGTIGGLGRGAGLAARAVVPLLANPITWVVIGIILLLAIFFFLILNKQLSLCPPWQGCGESQSTVDACLAQTAGSCPTQETIDANKKDRNTCKGLGPAINIFDTNFTNQQVNQYVDRYASESNLGIAEFQRRTRYIIEQSQAASLNPVIFLGLWRTESGFSKVSSASDLGCAPGAPSQQGFEQQVKCATGLTPGGSSTARCASSKDPNNQACQLEAGRIKSHPDIYGPYNISIPIATFDDFAGMYGPFSPILGDADQNNNCTHTYNQMLEVALVTNSCKASASLAATDLASCKFTKGDQTPKDLPFQSPLLLSYFQEVSQKTGVPATVLAGIARVESTTAEYTISNYTDEDIKAMAATAKAGGFGGLIGGTKKALCPTSSTGARGVMQIQPPGTTGHDAEAINNGARFISKDVSQLGLGDYCDPKTSIYLASGFILKKMQKLNYGDGTKWDPNWNNDKKYFDAVASSYYGCLKYPSCQDGPNSYGDDLWNSFNSCKGGTSQNTASTTTSTTTGVTTSSSISLTCPLDPVENKNFTISCGTKASPTNGCGHGGLGYEAVCNDKIYACTGPGGGYSIALTKSIDVRLEGGRASAGAPVYLPFINGNQSVNWRLQTVPIPIAGGSWGHKAVYTTNYQGKEITLDLTHINFTSVNSGVSGDKVSNVHSLGHLHTAVAIDGNWLEAEKEAGMCSKEAASYNLVNQTKNQKCECSKQTGANTTTNTSSAGSAQKTVVLDPGHGTSLTDSLAIGARGESEATIELARKIQTKLLAQGYTVKLTHDGGGLNPSDRYDDYQQRINVANSANAGLFIAIHFHRDSNRKLYSLYSNRKIISTDGRNTAPNPNIVTPNVDSWISNSRKINNLITSKIAAAVKAKYNIDLPASTEVADHGCEGRACGGHLYVLGPEGTLANPSEPGSTIKDEVNAVAAYIETGHLEDAYAKDYDLLADAYTLAIQEYFSGTSSSGVTNACLGGGAIDAGTFFCQSDPRWGGTNGDGSGCTLATGGCGPTTMATIFARLGITIPTTNSWQGIKIPDDTLGKEVNPLTVDSIYGANGFRKCATQSPLTHLKAFKDAGVLDYSLDLNPPSDERLKLLKQITDSGGLVIGSVNAYPLSGGGTIGHIFGISGIDLENRKFKLFDPAKCRASPSDPDTEVDFATVSSWNWFYNATITKK